MGRYTVQPTDIQGGYVSLFGYMNEDDSPQWTYMSKYTANDENTRIYFREAMSSEKKRTLRFTSPYGDDVEVYFSLKRAN